MCWHYNTDLCTPVLGEEKSININRNKEKERERVSVLVSGSKARWIDVKGKDHVHGSKVIKMG